MAAATGHVKGGCGAVEQNARRRSSHTRVEQWLKDSVANGNLRPGSAVPSVRALASKLGVAPHTAAVALVHAEREGLVVRRSPGARKRFVPNAPANSPLVSSTICVLGESLSDNSTAPRWSNAFVPLKLIQRLSGRLPRDGGMPFRQPHLRWMRIPLGGGDARTSLCRSACARICRQFTRRARLRRAQREIGGNRIRARRNAELNLRSGPFWRRPHL